MPKLVSNRSTRTELAELANSSHFWDPSHPCVDYFLLFCSGCYWRACIEHNNHSGVWKVERAKDPQMGPNWPTFALLVPDWESPDQKFATSTATILQFQQAAPEDVPRWDCCQGEEGEQTGDMLLQSWESIQTRISASCSQTMMIQDIKLISIGTNSHQK